MIQNSSRRFTLFPCEMAYHTECLIRRVLPLMLIDDRRRALALMRTLKVPLPRQLKPETKYWGAAGRNPAGAHHGGSRRRTRGLALRRLPGLRWARLPHHERTHTHARRTSARRRIRQKLARKLGASHLRRNRLQRSAGQRHRYRRCPDARASERLARRELFHPGRLLARCRLRSSRHRTSSIVVHANAPSERLPSPRPHFPAGRCTARWRGHPSFAPSRATSHPQPVVASPREPDAL